MKKSILKLALVFAVALTAVSCNEDYRGDNEGYLNDRDAVSYFSKISQTLFVKDGEASSVEVSVGSSLAKDYDRSFVVEVLSTSSAVEGIDYTANLTNLVIPAGQLFGGFTVNAGDFDNAVITGKTLRFKLTSVQDSELAYKLNSTVNIIKFCPLEADFTGDYFIEQLTAGNPDSDGVDVFSNQVVTLVDEGDTNRSFKAVYLEDLGIGQAAMTFKFAFVCNEVIVDSGNSTSLLCDQAAGPITLGPGLVPSAYDETDDSEFEITLTDYETDGGCGADPYQVTMRLTKQ